jgi:NAD(P)-dependent dehydrogenase (short-subunit alcohol dehydrogenase family)
MKLIWLFQSADDVMSNKRAFVTPTRTYTYADICKAVAHTIHVLGEVGVRRGQQVVLIPEHDENTVVFMAASPFNRLGTPQDVADVVTFLLSGGGRWITGQTITVDGGAT